MPNLLIAQEHLEDIEAAIDPGYVSYRYGHRLQAPIARFTQSGSDAWFHTVLYPFKDAAPVLSVRAIPVSGPGGSTTPAQAIRISMGEREASITDDCIFCGEDTRRLSFGSYTFTGSYLLFRRNVHGEIVSAIANPGACLEEAGQRIHLMSEAA
jgi:hypothetical protein